MGLALLQITHLTGLSKLQVYYQVKQLTSAYLAHGRQSVLSLSLFPFLLSLCLHFTFPQMPKSCSAPYPNTILLRRLVNCWDIPIPQKQTAQQGKPGNGRRRTASNVLVIFPVKRAFNLHQEMKLRCRAKDRAENQQEEGGKGEMRGPSCFSFGEPPAPAK